MKKRPQKLLIIGPNFFSVLPTSPKPAEISLKIKIAHFVSTPYGHCNVSK